MSVFFSVNVPASSDIFTLSLHDALPILVSSPVPTVPLVFFTWVARVGEFLSTTTRSVRHPEVAELLDRKSTRLNSSHRCTSYAVFCLKKDGMAPLSPMVLPPREVDPAIE